MFNTGLILVSSGEICSNVSNYRLMLILPKIQCSELGLFISKKIKCLAYVATLATCLIASTQHSSARHPSARVLSSGCTSDYPPLSLVDEAGQADGFSVELLREAAKRVGLTVDFTVEPWSLLKEKLEKRELDILPLVAYSEKRAEEMVFSQAYLVLHGAVFTRKNETSRFKTIEDLNGKQVIVMRGDIAEDFLDTTPLGEQRLHVGLLVEAMQLLAAGKGDCVIVDSLAGTSILKELDLEDQIERAIDHVVEMETRWAFAGPKGSESLISKLNEGLLLLRADGSYDQLYEKWLAPYMAPHHYIPNWIFYALALFIFTCIGSWVLFLVWMRTLRHTVLLRTKELKAARDNATAANRAKSEFLAKMSHELRTPLNPIIGFSDLILEADERSLEKDMVKIIRDAGSHMLELVEELLTFSRLESHKVEAKQKDVVLNELFSGVITALSSMAKQKGLDFQSHIQVPDEPVRCSAQILRQIVFNLIGNAIKFTESGFVKFEVSFEASDDEAALLRVVVSDSGIGISKDKQNVIFKPFEQIDNSHTREYSGVGLGLSITYEQVQLLGGSIRLDSQLGTGSCFEVCIPLVGYKIESASNVEDASVAGCIRTQSLHVMVVEDEKVNQIVIDKILTANGHRCTLFSSAQAAIDALGAGESYDLVLMDIKMPGIDGITATRMIRETLSKELPIIGLSADVRESTKIECEKAGMNAFFEKPIRLVAFKEFLAGLTQARS